MNRRLASSTENNAGNSHVKGAPSTYEMVSGETSRPTYTTLHAQPEAKKYLQLPRMNINATGNDGTRPSASPRRSNHDYLTLIHGYQPAYVKVQSEASAPAMPTRPVVTNVAGNGRKQPPASPSRSTDDDYLTTRRQLPLPMTNKIAF